MYELEAQHSLVTRVQYVHVQYVQSAVCACSAALSIRPPPQTTPNACQAKLSTLEMQIQVTCLLLFLVLCGTPLLLQP